jgi:hypothetical protein
MNEHDKMLREVTLTLQKSISDIDFDKTPLVVAQTQIEKKLMRQEFDEEQAGILSSYVSVDLNSLQITPDTLDTIDIFTDTVVDLIIKYNTYLNKNFSSPNVKTLKLTSLVKKMSLTFSE